jgi:hypothetical protein
VCLLFKDGGEDSSAGKSTGSDLGTGEQQLVGPLPTLGGPMASSLSGKRGTLFIHRPLLVSTLCCQLKAQLEGSFSMGHSSVRFMPEFFGFCRVAWEVAFERGCHLVGF